MRLLSGLAFLFVLVLTSSTRADIALPPNLKYVDPRVRFEGVEKHPDHVFYLRFLTFVGGPTGVPHRLIEVKDANVFNLNAQRRLLDMSLLALDRKTFEKRAKEDPALKWLSDKTEGVLKAAVTPPNTVALITAKEAPITSYRVTLAEGKLTVVETTVKPKTTPNEKQTDAAPAGPLPVWAFAILSVCCVAWFGVWYARRGK